MKHREAELCEFYGLVCYFFFWLTYSLLIGLVFSRLFSGLLMGLVLFFWGVGWKCESIKCIINVLKAYINSSWRQTSAILGRVPKRCF